MDDTGVFEIDWTIPFLLLRHGETRTLDIWQKLLHFPFEKSDPTTSSVNTFLMEKKVFILHRHFQIVSIWKRVNVKELIHA